MSKVLLLITLLLAYPATGSCGEKDFISPTLGLAIIDVPDKPLELKGIRSFVWPTKKGAIISTVWAGGPASRAKLKTSQIIIQIGNTRITTKEQAVAAIGGLTAGETVRVVYYDPMEINGKIRWKRRGTKVKVGTYWDVVESQMATDSDKLTEIVTYSHKDTPSGLTANLVSARISVVKNVAYPVMRIMRRGDDWLFVRSYSFLIDGKKYTLKPKHGDVSRDNSASTCWEWISELGVNGDKTDPVWTILSAVAKSTKCTVYYHGDQYREEHELSREEILNVQIVLEFLRGKIEGADKLP